VTPGLIRPADGAVPDTFRADCVTGVLDGRGDAALAVALGLLLGADAEGDEGDEGDAVAGPDSSVLGLGVPRVPATGVAAVGPASVSWSGLNARISAATSATAAVTAAETRAVRRLPDEGERCERDATVRPW